jgi:replicative DNA helicase
LYDETKVMITKTSLTTTIMDTVKSVQEASSLDQITEIIAKINDSVQMAWDQDLGISYVHDVEERIDRLCTKEDTIPTGIPSLDELIGGGMRRKSLFLAGGQSGVGKTLILGNLAANAMKRGDKVVYISLEIDKDIMSQRIDTVNIDMPINDLQDADMLTANRDQVIASIRAEHENNGGDIIIKEFPASKTNANDISAYLERLQTIKEYTPDLIVVDYLGLMCPIDSSMGKNSYERGKYVSEELRVIGFEFNCPIVSAVQTGRQSYGAEKVGMEDTSDSIAIVQTADTYVTLAKPQKAADAHQLYATVVKCRGNKEGGTCTFQIEFDKLKVSDAKTMADKKSDSIQKKAEDIFKERKKAGSRGGDNKGIK